MSNRILTVAEWYEACFKAWDKLLTPVRRGGGKSAWKRKFRAAIKRAA